LRKYARVGQRNLVEKLYEEIAGVALVRLEIKLADLGKSTFFLLSFSAFKSNVSFAMRLNALALSPALETKIFALSAIPQKVDLAIP
jgi:hypothetical protein